MNIKLEDLFLQSDGVEGVLLGSLQIAGVSFHVNAYAWDTEHNCPVNGSYAADEVLCKVDGECNHQTVDIDGRPYMIIIHPYQK
jgi:hypothetical protein